MTRVAVTFTVNGADEAEFVEAGTPLVDILRSKLELTGTKLGCAQGTCGACSVIVDGELKLACLVPAERLNGAVVETVEGLARDGRLHPIQRAFADGFAAQCGFCTSGMIIAAKALLDRNPDPDRPAVIDAISGNICRCTGYEPIINAVFAAAAELRAARGG